MDLTKIKSLLEEKIVSLGYEPVSITKRNEKCENILSIVIDKVEPIDMNMIVEVTNELSAYLDNIDDSNVDVRILENEIEINVNYKHKSFSKKLISNEPTVNYHYCGNYESKEIKNKKCN